METMKERRREGRSRIWEGIAKETDYIACVRATTRIRDEVHSFFF